MYQTSLEIQISPTFKSDYSIHDNQIYKLSYKENLSVKFKAIVKDFFYYDIFYFQSNILEWTNFLAKFEEHNDSKTLLIKNEKSIQFYFKNRSL